MDGRELRIPGDSAWRLELTPGGYDEVVLVRPGSRWSLWLQRRSGRFLAWYVNLERDHLRTLVGLDLVDEKLDLVISADESVRWKDEDELEQAHLVGYLDAVEVRAEAERVLADPPWPTGWETWQPDPAWPAPSLPAGWDVVSRDLSGACPPTGPVGTGQAPVESRTDVDRPGPAGRRVAR